MTTIIFLGTAGSSAVVSKQSRSSGGIILQLEDLQFHLDPGPGALNKAKEYGVNIQNTTAILISHNHINHCNDVNPVIDAMTHSGLDHRGIVMGSKSALQPTENNYPVVTRYHQTLVERIIPMEKDHKVGLDLVEIHALPVEHTDPYALGFKFYCPKFILSYTGDTRLTPQLLEGLKGTNILIMNVPYPGNKGQGLNLDTESAIKIVTQIKPKLVVMTHFGLEMIKADPLVEAREVQRITGVQTIAAKDGLIISTENFNNYDSNKSPVRGY